MRYLFIFLVITLACLAGCTDENDCCAPLDLGNPAVIYIKYVNQEGENLLETQGSNTVPEMQVFHLKEYGWERQRQLNQETPKGIYTYFWENEPYFAVDPPSYRDEQGYSSIRLVFPDGEQDTIRSLYRERGRFLTLREVFYNDELRWDISDDNDDNLLNYFVVVKSN